MNSIRSVFRLVSLPVLAALAAGCSTTTPTIQQGPDAELSFDGLHKVENPRASMAWARPDFDISGYTKIWLVGAGIEYRQVKDRGRTSMAMRSGSGPYFIDDKARERFEKNVTEVFTEEMAKSTRFELVDGPGPDVLKVRGGLLDVISYVPPETVGRSEVYLRSVGEATLVLELRDSETLTILARSIDRRAAEQVGGTIQYSSTVTNSAEARRLIRRWAVQLREALDGFLVE